MNSPEQDSNRRPSSGDDGSSRPSDAEPPRSTPPIQITPATTIAVQAGIGVVLGLIGFRVVEAVSAAPPTVPLTMTLLLAMTAALVIGLAHRTRNAVHRNRLWVEPSRGIRLLALGKAAVAGGAGLGGVQLGFLALLIGRLSVPANVERAIIDGVGVALCAAVVAGGLALQRACRIPDPPEQSK